MIKRDELKTTKELNGGEKNMYDIEREKIPSLARDYKSIQETLYLDDGAMRSPKQKYLETIKVRDEMRKMREVKAEFNFINKRDRIMRNSWKHGILGVEIPDDPGSDLFKNIQEQRNYQQSEKDHINGRRFKSKMPLLLYRNGTQWRCEQLN